SRPDGALPLAGTALWFTQVEQLSRHQPPRILPPEQADPEALERLTAPRPAIAGLAMDRPQIMGILNTTPDSFSDGGLHAEPQAAIAAALAMAEAGATIIDIGGESTRPGAATVPDAEEIARTAPVIAGLRRRSEIPISIDTRKAAVARAAIDAGATLVNDVAGFTFDPDLAPFAAGANLPVCVMHAQGDPATMHLDPRYDNVLLDVYYWLDTRLTALE
ncbi:dihydropteroate synthase, partial [bacterium]|nr:dihydropteroate synthase [bacterium]